MREYCEKQKGLSALQKQRMISKHKTTTQCCYNVGPPSSTLAQQCYNIGSMSRVCWDIISYGHMLPTCYSIPHVGIYHIIHHAGIGYWNNVCDVHVRAQYLTHQYYALAANQTKGRTPIHHYIKQTDDIMKCPDGSVMTRMSVLM